MDRYDILLRGFVHSSSLLICPVCGSETPSLKNRGICNICENVISMPKNELEGKDAELAEMLAEYESKIADGSVYDAIKAYDSIAEKHSSPSYMYMQGLNYVKASNSDIENIDYGLGGFMEENAARNDKAAESYRKAREYFADALANIEEAPDSIYAGFLSCLKLKDAKQAKLLLGKLNGNAYLYAYASVLFDSFMGNFDGVISKAERMMDERDYPITLFYYIALALFKKKKYAEAGEIAKELSGSISSPNLEALIGHIEKHMQSPD